MSSRFATGFIAGLVIGVGAMAFVFHRTEASDARETTRHASAAPRESTPAADISATASTSAVETTATHQQTSHAPESAEAPARALAKSSVRTPRAVPDILAALRECVANDGSAVLLGHLLDELRNSGPDGPRLVVDAFLDPELACDGHARAFGQALAQVDDPRIAPAARGWLEKNFAAGDNDWRYTFGYPDLVAAKGGPEDQKILLETLKKPGQASSGAAKAVAYLAGRGVDPKPYLEQLPETLSRGNAAQFAASLARWNDPAVDDALWQAAADPNATNSQLDEALQNIAQREGDTAFERYQRESSSAATSAQKANLVPALFGYRESAAGSTEVGRRKFEDEALRALGGDDMEVCVALAGGLRYAKGAATPAMIDGFARLPAESMNESQREIVRDCQKALAKDLKKSQSAQTSK